MTRRRLLVLAAGVEWDAITGTDQHLARRLAEHVDVLWVDPPVSVVRARSRAAGDGPRVGRSLSDVAPGVRRLSAVAPPYVTRPVVRALVRRQQQRALVWALRRDGRAPWAVVSSRPERVLADVAPGPVRVYFATDDFAAGAELLGLPATRLRRAEQEQVAAADLLVGVTPQIVARWRCATPALVLPNGCDTDSYADADTAPADLGLPGPVAGMVGQLSARIDLGLLEAVADTGASLVLVGPRDPGFDPPRVDALLSRPTVHWTGRVPFAALPAYLAAIDVGLTPYADTTFNRASFPLKTLEYLAAGLPVVSTPLPAVDQLGTDRVRTAAGPRAYAATVLQELEASRRPGAAERAEVRRAVARQHDWGVRASTLLAAIEEVQAGRALKSSVASRPRHLAH